MKTKFFFFLLFAPYLSMSQELAYESEFEDNLYMIDAAVNALQWSLEPDEARLDVDDAHLEVDLLKAQFLPRFSYSVSFLYAQNPQAFPQGELVQRRARISMNLLLFDPAIRTRIQAGKFNINAQQDILKQNEQNAAQLGAESFLDVLIERENLMVLHDNIHTLSCLMDTEKPESLGIVRPEDFSRVEASINTAKGDFLAVQTDQIQREVAFLFSTNIDLTQTGSYFLKTPEKLDIPKKAEDSFFMALADNYELSALQHEGREKRNLTLAERREAYPTLSLDAGYADESRPNSDFKKPYQHGEFLMLRLDGQIPDRTNRIRIQNRQNSEERTVIAIENMTRRIRARIQGLYTSLINRKGAKESTYTNLPGIGSLPISAENDRGSLGVACDSLISTKEAEISALLSYAKGKGDIDTYLLLRARLVSIMRELYTEFSEYVRDTIKVAAITGNLDDLLNRAHEKQLKDEKLEAIHQGHRPSSNIRAPKKEQILYRLVNRCVDYRYFNSERAQVFMDYVESIDAEIRAIADRRR